MSGAKILVVDDEPQIRRMVRATLTGTGHQVDEARTGEEALEKFRTFLPDLVLLELNMPGIGGLEACRAQRIRCADHYSDRSQYREGKSLRRWTPEPTITFASHSACRS